MFGQSKTKKKKQWTEQISKTITFCPVSKKK